MNGLKRMMMAAVVATATVAGTTAVTTTAHAADKKFGGTGRCEFQCKNGTCKYETCSGSGYFTIEDAKRDLKLKLEAKARAEGATIKGEISFSIEVKL